MHLDRILDGLTAHISPFKFADVDEETIVELTADSQPSMQYVLSGHGRAWRPSGETIPLLPYTVIIVPPGASLEITCGCASRHRHRRQAWVPYCGEWLGAATVFECQSIRLARADFRADYMYSAGLFDYLHEPLVMNFCKDDHFRRAFKLLMREASTARPGSQALSEAAFRECLIGILRRLSQSDGEFSGAWMAAVTNSAMGRAIKAILKDPQKPHTLSSLAETAGMSRTPFVAQFKEFTGSTPISYLRDVRMRWAIRLLTSTNLPIKAIATRVGIGSRSYFSKAFKGFTGTDPGTFRNRPH